MVKAVLIAYEPFNYATGSTLAGQGAGIGWSIVWITSPLNSQHSSISASNLFVARLAVTGNRLRTVNSGSDIRDFRQLDATSTAVAPWLDGFGKFGKDGTTLWIAFAIRLAGGANTGNGGIHLYDGLGNLNLSADGDKANHERVFMGDRASGTNWFFGRTCGGCPCAVIAESTTLVNGTIHLLVYCYDFTNNGVNLHLFIDPTPGVPPTNSTAAVSLTNLCAFDFDYVELGSGGESVDVDEFRIATTYEEATPTVPTLLAITLTNNIARVSLTGNDAQTYFFEATTNLSNWTSVGSGTTTNGIFQFNDTNAAQFPWRFYRALLP